MADDPIPFGRPLRLIEALRDALDDPLLTSFLEGLPGEPEFLRPTEPKTLPVLRHLDQAAAAAPPAARPILEYLRSHSSSLTWGQTYSAEDFGDAFLDRYGWTEFAGLRGPIPSDRTACGVLFLGPELEYPDHAHQAEELYIPLTGTAAWRRGEGEFIERPAMEIIHHESWTRHAMKTRAEPLIAFYAWRGGDLVQKSKFGAEIS